MLDCVLGGGWPLGRIVNIVGDKSTGKTLLAMEAIANFFQQYPDGHCWYNEAESAFDGDYARALGIPFNNVTFIEDCSTVEELFDSIDGIIKVRDGDKTPCLYIIDSMDALSDKAELDRGIAEASYGGSKAKQLSSFFRRISKSIGRTNLCFMIISQVRDNIGVSFGNKYSRSGGHALDFYASQILWLAHTGILKRTVDKVVRPVGVSIKANCKKNKVSMPFRQCEFDITFGYGMEDRNASLAWLKELKHPVSVTIGDAELRKVVIAKWYDIEKSFLPTRTKYDAS